MVSTPLFFGIHTFDGEIEFRTPSYNENSGDDINEVFSPGIKTLGSYVDNNSFQFVYIDAKGTEYDICDDQTYELEVMRVKEGTTSHGLNVVRHREVWVKFENVTFNSCASGESITFDYVLILAKFSIRD